MAHKIWKLPGLTGNQLKIIAMVTMTLDHMGLLLFPQVALLRWLGRLSMPIYAYMIAEGCRHTRNRKRYLLRLLGLGILCQVVYFVSMGSLYMCILITFSLSVGVILAAEWAGKKGEVVRFFTIVGAILLVRVICDVVPLWLPGTDYAIDYGTVGVMLPVLAYYGKTKPKRLALFALGLSCLAWDCGGNQWLGLAALPLLALYNGQRGKYAMGKLFYVYYPAHLVVLYGLSMIF